MPNPLSHLEDLAEQLVEAPFARVFRARLQPIEVARRLARAMEDGQVINAQGQYDSLLLEGREYFLAEFVFKFDGDH